MKHEEATALLPLRVAGGLAPEQGSRLDTHLADCPDCRGWLETWELLAAAARPAAAHPAPERLAAFAVEPADLDDEESHELRVHLEGCSSCRRELRWTRAALAEAKEDEVATAGWPRWLGRHYGGRRLAAGLFLGLLGMALLVYTLRLGRPSPDLQITQRSFQGSEIVEADGTLSAAASRVTAYSDVVFRAGGSVALGEGFVVGEGATFTVEVSGGKPPRRPRKTDSIDSSDPPSSQTQRRPS